MAKVNELEEIIRGAIKTPNPKCPECKVEGVVKAWGELAWCECPNCGRKIGEMVMM